MVKFVGAAAIGLFLAAGAALAASPEGTWLSQDRDTKVHVANCGGKMCGTVVWLGKPTDANTGKPKTDKLNPDPAKRSRPCSAYWSCAGCRRVAPTNGPAPSIMPTTARSTRRA